MSNEQVWVIQTEDLQVGTILSFDLTDASGNVLHKAGTPISDRLKSRLHKNSIDSVTIRGATHFASDQPESILLDSFPPGSIASLQKSIAASQLAIGNLVAAIEKKEELDVSELKGNADGFVEQATNDIAAALAAIAIRSKSSDTVTAEWIAERSSKLAFLSVVTSILDGDSPEESSKIGLAGLLHDCSLLLHSDWFAKDPSERGRQFVEEYQRHPIESAELLTATDGVAVEVIEMIYQVHEQADGSGYPRKLVLDQVQPGASILNLADAYLTLVEPLRGYRHVPSDAIAYLCYHTAQGKFSKPVLQAMLQGMSIYPVGSTVVLDDQTTAIVVRGTPGSPMEPVVRLFEPGNLKIDLAESSRSIAAPLIDIEQTALERIPKSRMHEVLWRTDR